MPSLDFLQNLSFQGQFYYVKGERCHHLLPTSRYYQMTTMYVYSKWVKHYIPRSSLKAARGRYVLKEEEKSEKRIVP